MKRLVLVAVCFCLLHSYAQNSTDDIDRLQFTDIAWLDSMEHQLPTMVDETSKAKLLGKLSYYFAFNFAEKSVLHGQRGLLLSQQLGYKKGVAYCNQSLGSGLWGVGDYSKALQTALNTLRLYQTLKDEEQITVTYWLLANIYRDVGDYEKALANAKKGLKMNDAMSVNGQIGFGIIGSIYDLQNRLNSANFYIQRSGLGLSLSYDIVTKGHVGKMSVESKEGEGSEFIINIPIT